jgi:hypothetical protein
LVFLTRLMAIHDMAAPSWGDSVHHTLIVQLFLDNGGLFDSWQPYAPLESMSYHFGFHAATASWAWLTGQSAASSVLLVGQIFNVLAVLSLFSLVCRLSGSLWAGLASLIVAGLIFPFPGYYVNWGRYTQLTGQILLPALVLLFDIQWSGEKKPPFGGHALTAVLLSGLVLCHYRVTLLAGAAALSWGIWGLWQKRKKLSAWIGQAFALGASTLAACLLLLPFFLKFTQSQVYTLVTKGKDFLKARDIEIWARTSFYFSDWFLILACIALVAAFFLSRRLALPLAGWCLVAFSITNLSLIGLPAFSWTNNMLLLFAIYIPFGVLLGWISGWMMEGMAKKKTGLLAALCIVVFFLGWGSVRQMRIVDPFFQMVTPADKASFEWIKSNIPEDAVFLINGFQAYPGKLVVGSDAGWWLPYYTQRSSKILPALYLAEKVDPSVDTASINELLNDINAASQEPHQLRSVLCRYGITHIFLGQKRGAVGYGAEALIPEAWLSENPDYTLLFQKDMAQVWRVICEDKSSKTRSKLGWIIPE